MTALAAGPEPSVGFIDHHRQHYAERAPIEEAAEFFFGLFLENGEPAPGGSEFRVVLVELRGELVPQVRAFGDGADCLRRAIAAGLLDLLASPVAGHVEFSRRLDSAGFLDLSDLGMDDEEAGR